MIDRKIIQSGHGYRIVDPRYSQSWGGFKSGTVVVRIPNSRNQTFRTSLIATEGIQGQPQLTFDSEQVAQAWLDSHEEYRRRCRVGGTRSTYDCVKIPLEDGSEGYLSVSMLNPGSDY
jgi:hypothetical protein